MSVNYILIGKIRQKLDRKQLNQMVNVEIESHLQIIH